MTYRRPQHAIIASALRAMNGPWLLENHCWFGGGTAIVLRHGEYRQSLDVDFLCDDTDGYRALRSVAGRGAAALFGPDVGTAREFRADQYGIRGQIVWQGQRIKVEIVREARIPIKGALDRELGVPVLDMVDQCAEKLLVNADPCQDAAFAYRDAIDLGYLVEAVGGVIPAAAIGKAERAYGHDISSKAAWVVGKLGGTRILHEAAARLEMRPEDAEHALRSLRPAVAKAWPALGLADAARGCEPDDQ